MTDWVGRLADACWMAFTGSLLSFALVAFCLPFDVLAIVGRALQSMAQLVLHSTAPPLRRSRSS